MKTGYIGVDPGQDGAAALLYETAEGLKYQLIDAGNYDFLNMDSMADLCASLAIWETKCLGLEVWIEKVRSFSRDGRKQGGSSSFKFGNNYGLWQGLAVGALRVVPILIEPKEWQGAVFKMRQVIGGDTKDRSLIAARKIFGDQHLKRKKDHGRADALNIAYLGYLRGGGYEK